MAGELHYTSSKPRPQRTPQGLQQQRMDVLNKPNVRSKQLLLQPHIRLARDGEGTRENIREKGGCGEKMKEEMWTLRNNERSRGKIKGMVGEEVMSLQ